MRHWLKVQYKLYSNYFQNLFSVRKVFTRYVGYVKAVHLWVQPCNYRVR